MLALLYNLELTGAELFSLRTLLLLLADSGILTTQEEAVLLKLDRLENGK